MSAKKFPQLNTLATELVGDGQKPNLFFVTHCGNVQTVTASFEVAYKQWRSIVSEYPHQESAIEDRKTGVIASREPEEEGSSKLITIDDSVSFKFRKAWEFAH